MSQSVELFHAVQINDHLRFNHRKIQLSQSLCWGRYYNIAVNAYCTMAIIHPKNSHIRREIIRCRKSQEQNGVLLPAEYQRWQLWHCVYRRYSYWIVHHLLSGIRISARFTAARLMGVSFMRVTRLPFTVNLCCSFMMVIHPLLFAVHSRAYVIFRFFTSRRSYTVSDTAPVPAAISWGVSIVAKYGSIQPRHRCAVSFSPCTSKESDTSIK